MESKVMVMDIADYAFADVRDSFNRVLNAVLKKMHVRDSDESDITLKVTIKLQNVKTTDARTGEILDIKRPEIGYKVTHKLSYKTESQEEGSIQQEDSQIVFNPESQQWEIWPITQQMTIAQYMDRHAGD